MAGSTATIMTFPEAARYKPENTAEIGAQHDAFLWDNPASDAVQSLRRQGMAALAAQGLPTARLERWKYTNLAAALKDLRAAPVGGARLDVTAADGLVTPLTLGADQALPAWVQELLAAAPSGEAQYRDHALWHMNNAFLRDGVVVDIPANKSVDNPVEITIGGADGHMIQPRMLIRVGDGAEVTIIERHEGAGTFWNNQLTQVIVGQNAKIHHYRVQDYGPAVMYTQNTYATIARDATYEAFTLTTGGALSRNQIHTALQGVNGTCNTYGVNLLRRAQLGDTTITIEHQAPHCNSNQFYRSVLDEQAHGVFQGKVHVHQPAQKTDGYQLANALILSEGAEMSTKPELEIYADDVKCSHGATVGQLDEQALFYMRSRGIPLEAARGLLIAAFAHEVLERLADPVLNDTIGEKVAAWLA